jgi:hypothetical protein
MRFAKEDPQCGTPYVVTSTSYSANRLNVALMNPDPNNQQAANLNMQMTFY